MGRGAPTSGKRGVGGGGRGGGKRGGGGGENGVAGRAPAMEAPARAGGEVGGGGGGGAADAAAGVGRDVGGGGARAQAAEGGVDKRNDGVEVRAGNRAEHEDEGEEAGRRRRRVLEQLQPGVARRERGRGDPRADHG